MTAITLWTTDRCVQCDSTKRKLDKEGVPYQTNQLDDHARERFRQLGIMQAPVVEVPGKKPFGGFNPSKLDDAITQHRALTRPVTTGPEMSGPSVT